MKQFKYLFFTLLATAVFLFPSCSDDDNGDDALPITATGVVSDVDGNLLEGVTVASVNDSSVSTTTDAAGTFSITVNSDDQLTFTLENYSTVTETPALTMTVTMTISPAFDFARSFASNNNIVADPQFAANSIIPGNTGLGSTASSTSSFIQNVSYKGAVDPSGTPWYAGWSFYENLLEGNLESDPINTAGLNIVTVTDGDLPTAPGMSVTWTNDNIYVLDGFVFVENGVTLNIEAGTIIQGKPGEAENASALIVARGGNINAMGTATQPIIFTYEGDNGNSSATLRGQWGGLIILGNASLNSEPGESAIEGIPTNDTRGSYGGTEDSDNSGTLNYVSIRHGGTLIGGDNEINGLTLGGVGSGTTIEYVEVIGNRDDGIEWFGGTVNGKHLIAAFCADDALDYDEGYRGLNQYVVVHQDPTVDAADRGGEHDGGTDPETGTPFATPEFWNVTSIGNSGSRTITFRDNAGGAYANGIFTGYERGIDVEDLEDQTQDSYRQFQDGNLNLLNNVFFNIGAGDNAADIFTISN